MNNIITSTAFSGSELKTSQFFFSRTPGYIFLVWGVFRISDVLENYMSTPIELILLSVGTYLINATRNVEAKVLY